MKRVCGLDVRLTGSAPTEDARTASSKIKRSALLFFVCLEFKIYTQHPVSILNVPAFILKACFSVFIMKLLRDHF